jgi:hypothetical protein
MLSFVQFSENPATGNNSPFQICIAGGYGLGFALSIEMRGVTIGKRQTEVRWVKKEQELRGCQLVFIKTSSNRGWKALLEAAKSKGLLTIGDGEGFLAAGGAVQLGWRGDAMQFEVDLGAAQAAGVRIDARLLAMAKRVVKVERISGG